MRISPSVRDRSGLRFGVRFRMGPRDPKACRGLREEIAGSAGDEGGVTKRIRRTETRAGAGSPHWSFVVRAPFCPIVLRSTPTCSSSISTTSPGCIADVDPGVPVKIMSPGSRVT